MDERGWHCPHCDVALITSSMDELRCRCGWGLHRKGRRWLMERDMDPKGFDRAAVERLQLMENHFWMRERRYLMDHLLRRLGTHGQQAAELGCGTGSNLPLLEERFARVTAIDGYATLLERAERNSVKAELLQADVCRSPLAGGIFELVMAMDVIEHVDPDGFLTEARRIAVPGGTLLLSAPAAPSLWSRMDEMAGHRCRYTRRQMEDELRRNGWIPAGFTHYQCLLFPLVWLSSKLGTRADDKFERKPPAWLDRVLGGVSHLETTLCGGLPLPFGSSLIMWAKAG